MKNAIMQFSVSRQLSLKSILVSLVIVTIGVLGMCFISILQSGMFQNIVYLVSLGSIVGGFAGIFMFGTYDNENEYKGAN